MQGVFVSYRRQDSQSAAGRLSDHLKEHLDGVPIFRDVETIEPGVDFVEAIERALKSCGVVLAVIGPRWIDAQDSDGNRRLDDAGDFTRLEIATALKRGDVRVIPVLVEGAEMPATDRLPDDLEALARRNAIELTDKRWDFDVSQLVDTLRKVLEVPERAEPVPPPPPPVHSGSSRKGWIGGALAAVIALGVIGAFVEEEPDSLPVLPDANVEPQSDPVPDPVIAPAAASEVDLTGFWRDTENTNTLEIVQRGGTIEFKGQAEDGYVTGGGKISGLVGEARYTVDGHPWEATLNISPDGSRINVAERNPATGERYAWSLVRAR